MCYTGIQIDLRLTRTLPQQVAQWLSLHTQGKGNLKPMNRIMGQGSSVFKNWEGGFFRLTEDHPVHGTHWHLKTNGSTDEYSVECLTFFLHEIQPWLLASQDEVIARVIPEELGERERLFWIDRATTLVTSRLGREHSIELIHPKNWEVWTLLEPLGTNIDGFIEGDGSWKQYNYAVNAVVSPKQEEKKILARIHNENREKDKIAELQKQIDALEGK